MGCWGITAFESDEGLDAVEFIRESIPEDGKLELETLVETLKRDSWNAPPEVETAGSHTSVMVLAELMLKFVDGDVNWNREEHKFCSVTSFTASKETVHWIRNYLFDTLHHVKKHAGSQTEDGGKWGDGLRKRTGLAGRSIWRRWSAVWIPFWRPKETCWSWFPNNR